jgi:hypothetical protein
LLQELHGIRGSIIARTNIRPKASRPRCTAKWPGERREALKAEVTDRRLTFPNGLQAIENLKTLSATARVDSAKAKMMTTIITHVKEDLEENTP